MTTPYHWQQLEQMYHSAPINTTIPSVMKVGQGSAEVTIDIGPHLYHSAQSLHGSIYFKAMDDAAFFAAASIETENFILTARFKVELYQPIIGSQIISKGHFEKRDGKKIWAGAELFDNQNTLAARGEGLFIVSKHPLTNAQGYTSLLPQ